MVDESERPTDEPISDPIHVLAPVVRRLDDIDRDQAVAAIVELIMSWWREHTDPPPPETKPPHRGHQPTGR